MRVPFSYLDRQFVDVETCLEDIRKLARSGEFTLGPLLSEFEGRFAAVCGVREAVGVASGTDALILALKMLGIGPGDEVITTPMTFIATVGAIVAVGARPVFVDSEEGFLIDPAKVEEAITPKTRALLPIHYAGNAADMPALLEIARRHKLFVVEDACQAVGAAIDGRPVGSWGDAACFSLHPLKNINVWGDGGVVVTRSPELAQRLRLYRNHGLVHRDEAVLFGINSRLDTLQAIIGNRLIQRIEAINHQRRANAQQYDEAFSPMGDFIQVPPRRPEVRHAFHLYMVRVQRRDPLLAYLNQEGIEAKVHYPIPVHLQKAARSLGYREGDFPMCEEDCRRVITLPVHQHLIPEEIGCVIGKIRQFYLKEATPLRQG